MISTFQALIVAGIALLPGASYTFAFERLRGPYGASFADRLVRFLAASAVFAATYSGPLYLLYRHYIANGRLRHGHVNAWAIEAVALVYVFVPILAGTLVAAGYERQWWWARLAVGPSPEPRAWDYVWTRPDTAAVIRLRLKSGTWLAGVWATSRDNGGTRSYAAGYPEDGDLYLSLALKIDPQTGELEKDTEGRVSPYDGNPGLFLRWAEVEYLDRTEFEV